MKHGRRLGKSILILAILSLLTGTLYGQTTSELLKKRYEQALLDSAIRYEALKPVTFHLQLENQHLIKSNLELRIQMDFKDKKEAETQKFYLAQLAALRKKNRARFGLGAGLGALAAVITLKL